MTAGLCELPPDRSINRSVDIPVFDEAISRAVTVLNTRPGPPVFEAISRAVELARAGDVVVVAGKGHEDYQIVGDERRHFDDREVLRDCLKGGQ